MSVAGAVDALGRESVSRVRAGAGTYVDGYWQAGATTAATILASVQPASGRDLQVSPDGQRADETKVFFSTSDLRTGEPGAHSADVLVYEGFSWRVYNVQTWVAFGGTYYRAVAAKLQPTIAVGGASVTDAGDTVHGVVA